MVLCCALLSYCSSCFTSSVLVSTFSIGSKDSQVEMERWIHKKICSIEIVLSVAAPHYLSYSVFHKRSIVAVACLHLSYWYENMSVYMWLRSYHILSIWLNDVCMCLAHTMLIQNGGKSCSTCFLYAIKSLHNHWASSKYSNNTFTAVAVAVVVLVVTVLP